MDLLVILFTPTVWLLLMAAFARFVHAPCFPRLWVLASLIMSFLYMHWLVSGMTPDAMNGIVYFIIFVCNAPLWLAALIMAPCIKNRFSKDVNINC